MYLRDFHAGSRVLKVKALDEAFGRHAVAVARCKLLVLALAFKHTDHGHARV